MKYNYVYCHLQELMIVKQEISGTKKARLKSIEM